jgi:hypothetical protein
MTKQEYIEKNPTVDYIPTNKEFVIVGQEIPLDGKKCLIPILNEKEEVIYYFEFSYGMLQTEMFAEIESKYKNLR